jgi:hypothetical protein
MKKVILVSSGKNFSSKEIRDKIFELLKFLTYRKEKT